MPDYLNALVLDRGLVFLVASVDHVLITKAVTLSYEASIDPANVLAQVPTVLVGPRNHLPNGREVAVPAGPPIPITADGQATAYALIDEENLRLLASAALKFPRDVLAGQSFDLEELVVALPGLP